MNRFLLFTFAVGIYSLTYVSSNVTCPLTTLDTLFAPSVFTDAVSTPSNPCNSFQYTAPRLGVRFLPTESTYYYVYFPLSVRNFSAFVEIHQGVSCVDYNQYACSSATYKIPYVSSRNQFAFLPSRLIWFEHYFMEQGVYSWITFSSQEGTVELGQPMVEVGLAKSPINSSFHCTDNLVSINNLARARLSSVFSKVYLIGNFSYYAAFYPPQSAFYSLRLFGSNVSNLYTLTLLPYSCASSVVSIESAALNSHALTGFNRIFLNQEMSYIVVVTAIANTSLSDDDAEFQITECTSRMMCAEVNFWTAKNSLDSVEIYLLPPLGAVVLLLLLICVLVCWKHAFLVSALMLLVSSLWVILTCGLLVVPYEIDSLRIGWLVFVLSTVLSVIVMALIVVSNYEDKNSSIFWAFPAFNFVFRFLFLFLIGAIAFCIALMIMDFSQPMPCPSDSPQCQFYYSVPQGFAVCCLFSLLLCVGFLWRLNTQLSRVSRVRKVQETRQRGVQDKTVNCVEVDEVNTYSRAALQKMAFPCDLSEVAVVSWRWDQDSPEVESENIHRAFTIARYHKFKFVAFDFLNNTGENVMEQVMIFMSLFKFAPVIVSESHQEDIDRFWITHELSFASPFQIVFTRDWVSHLTYWGVGLTRAHEKGWLRWIRVLLLPFCPQLWIPLLMYRISFHRHHRMVEKIFLLRDVVNVDNNIKYLSDITTFVDSSEAFVNAWKVAKTCAQRDFLVAKMRLKSRAITLSHVNLLVWEKNSWIQENVDFLENPNVGQYLVGSRSTFRQKRPKPSFFNTVRPYVSAQTLMWDEDTTTALCFRGYRLKTFYDYS